MHESAEDEVYKTPLVNWRVSFFVVLVCQIYETMIALQTAVRVGD